MKKTQGRIVLHRETLRTMTLDGPSLRRLAGGFLTEATCGHPCSQLCTHATACTFAAKVR